MRWHIVEKATAFADLTPSHGRARGGGAPGDRLRKTGAEKV
jgi:hypothetical protein